MPKQDDRKKCYNILGLDGTANEDDIKRAFTRLALTYHPDLCLKRPDELGKHKYHDVCKAFKRLSAEDSNVSDWNNDKSDEIFFSLLREPLQNCSRAGVLYSLLSSSLNSQSHFQNDNLYRCQEDAIEDIDVEGHYIQMLISILENRLKNGKSVPAGLTHEKISKLHCEFNRLKDAEKKSNQEKLSLKKPVNTTPSVTPVAVAKPKPKSKKQLQAEQRRRELEMSKIAQELDEKRKKEEEKENARKQLEVERQQKLEEQQRKEEEERKRQQQEVKRKREREEKEKESKLQKEREKQEKIRKQQEEEKKRKAEEKAARSKAMKEAKEKEEREKQDVAKKSQQMKRQQQYQQYQQQQQKYPREVPPRFLKQQKNIQGGATDTPAPPPEEIATQGVVESSSKPAVATADPPTSSSQEPDEEWGGVPVSENWDNPGTEGADGDWPAVTVGAAGKPPSVPQQQQQQQQQERDAKCSDVIPTVAVGDVSNGAASGSGFGAIGDSTNRNSPLWGGPDALGSNWTPRTSDSGAQSLPLGSSEQLNKTKTALTLTTGQEKPAGTCPVLPLSTVPPEPEFGLWNKAPGQPVTSKADRLNNDVQANTYGWPALDKMDGSSTSQHVSESGARPRLPAPSNGHRLDERDIPLLGDDVRRRESVAGSGSYGRELAEINRGSVGLDGLDVKLDSNAKVTGWLATSPCVDELETNWNDDNDYLEADLDNVEWGWTTTARKPPKANTSDQSKATRTSSPPPSAMAAPVADPSVAMLIDMGFLRGAAEKALKENNGVVESAVSALLNLGDEARIDCSPTNAHTVEAAVDVQSGPQAVGATTEGAAPQKLNRKQRRKLQQQRQLQQQQQPQTSVVVVETPTSPTRSASSIGRSSPGAQGIKILGKHLEADAVHQPETPGRNPEASNPPLPHAPAAPARFATGPTLQPPSVGSHSIFDPILASQFLVTKQQHHASMGLPPASAMPHSRGHMTHPYPSVGLGATSRVDRVLGGGPMTSAAGFGGDHFQHQGLTHSKLMQWKQGGSDRREAPSVSVDPISAKWGVVAAPKLSPTPAEFKPGVQWKSKADLERMSQEEPLDAGPSEGMDATRLPRQDIGNEMPPVPPLEPFVNPPLMDAPRPADATVLAGGQALWNASAKHAFALAPSPWLILRGLQPSVSQDNLKSVCQSYGRLTSFIITASCCFARYENEAVAREACNLLRSRLAVSSNLVCDVASDASVTAELQRTTQPKQNYPAPPPNMGIVVPPASNAALGLSSAHYDSANPATGDSRMSLLSTRTSPDVNAGFGAGHGSLSMGPLGPSPWSTVPIPPQQAWLPQQQQQHGMGHGGGPVPAYGLWHNEPLTQQQQQQQQQQHGLYSAGFPSNNSNGGMYTTERS